MSLIKRFSRMLRRSTRDDRPWAHLLDDARAAGKIVIQIFSASAMQDPTITIQEKAEDIKKYGFTFWYTGMPSIRAEHLWECSRTHQFTYLYMVLTGNCYGNRYAGDPSATEYKGADGVWHRIPDGIDQRIGAGARNPIGFRIDKFQPLRPAYISEAWFSEFPYGISRGALLVDQYQLPSTIPAARGVPSRMDMHWVGIGRLCGDFAVKLR